MRGPDEKKIDTLHDLIDDIEIAMLTTRRADGRLVSRPMATQQQEDVADLWFVTDIESHKMDELRQDPHVNVAYYDSGSYEWVSVSGTARISTDREKIHELWRPDWKAWFAKVDEVRDGGPDDPRLALIFVDADSVTYMKKDKPKPIVLFEVARGILTGKQPDVGTVEEIRL